MNRISSNIVDSAEVYDPISGVWNITGSLTDARSSHTTTLLPDGRVLVSGGNDGTNALSSAELFDPVTGTWSAQSPLNFARVRHSATLLGDGRVVVLGGGAAEGIFWESVNAIGVLQAPAIITVYDDGYGISVPNQFQMVKENINDILKGFQREPCPEPECQRGYELFVVRGWDYPSLLETYAAAAEIAREYHIPALVHVTEVTQPQAHSTSGSHERYKSAERLKFEEEFDSIHKMMKWMLEN